MQVDITTVVFCGTCIEVSRLCLCAVQYRRPNACCVLSHVWPLTLARFTWLIAPPTIWATHPPSHIPPANQHPARYTTSCAPLSVSPLLPVVDVLVLISFHVLVCFSNRMYPTPVSKPTHHTSRPSSATPSPPGRAQSVCWGGSCLSSF